ncbi:unnamed protein product [Nippostrongylus brasiliensis]|uniref:Trimethylguanosine synthase n=1 Tax=Nippostrongylus brasiliensis TaxID=27835 RepID=A0A0N4YER2_NIPBR|nr:unnamed protein product [Nippostrongylus brasiliensis]
MTENESSTDDEFKFPWELLADFYAVYHKRSAKDVTIDYDCCLSRAHLNDKDLVKLSERKAAPEAGDTCGLVESTETMSLTEPNEDGDGLSLQDSPQAATNSTEKGEKPLELTSDAWAELPKRFGTTKKDAHSKFYRKRKRTLDDAQKWLRNTTFEEYWEDTASYLIYRTWYEDYGNIMNDDDREKLAKQVEDCKPLALIDEHTDEQISKYFGLTKDAKFSTYEELFLLHSEKVLELATKDFETFRCSLTAHRCKTFLKKIEKMGFVPGYTEGDIVTPERKQIDKEEDEEVIVKKKRTNSSSERRFPVIYGDDEIFSDVYYDVYDPYAASTYVVLDRKENSLEEEPSEDDQKEEDTQVTRGDIPTSGDTEIRFAFDPEKDAHLLAKNAFEAYQDDKEIIKYWYQRYRLFSKLDKGILMDREGWFSVTPERIAEHIADRIVRRPGMLVVDAFAGVGGNSIQLALKGAQVIAIDLDPVRLKCARENAKVYGVEERIEFICADFFHVASKWTSSSECHSQVDAVFLSPPWGGPSYLKSKDFDLDDLTPNGFDIFTAAQRMSPNIAYFLPRNTKVKQLISLSGEGGRCEIEQSCLNKKIKTLTVYYGNLAIQR